MRTACLILASLTMFVSAVILNDLRGSFRRHSSLEAKGVYASACMSLAILFGTGLLAFAICAASAQRQPSRESSDAGSVGEDAGGQTLRA
jgi:hypothetical protein